METREFNPSDFSVEDLENERLLDDQTPDYILEHRDEFLTLLESADISLKGNIEEMRADLQGKHANQVIVAEIPYSKDKLPDATGSSKIRFFEIMYEGKPIVAVFKPFSGESPARQRDFEVRQMYTRERAAYVVDYAMDLGIVPPTIITTIDGEIGSLQLYIPHTTAKSPNVDENLHHNQDFNGREWKKMAILDVLIGNRDRNNGNYLICYSDPSRFFAIDHGCSFCRPKKGDPTLTYDYFQKNPDQAELDEDLRLKLQQLLDKEEEVMASLPKEISGYIKYQASNEEMTIFDKARKMLETNSFLIENDDYE